MVTLRLRIYAHYVVLLLQVTKHLFVSQLVRPRYDRLVANRANILDYMAIGMLS